MTAWDNRWDPWLSWQVMNDLKHKITVLRRPLKAREVEYWNMVVSTTRVYYRSHPAASWPLYPECRYEWGITKRPAKPRQADPNRKRRNKVTDDIIRAIRYEVITRGKERNVEALAKKYDVSPGTIQSIAYNYGRYKDI